jgi:hypothetical protein
VIPGGKLCPTTVTTEYVTTPRSPSVAKFTVAYGASRVPAGNGDAVEIANATFTVNENDLDVV